MTQFMCIHFITTIAHAGGVVLFLATSGLGAESSGKSPTRTRTTYQTTAADIEAIMLSAEHGSGLAQAAPLLANGATGESKLLLSVEHDGHGVVTVPVGATLEYQVVGVLTDDSNEGLALFGITLSFNGGALDQAFEPTGEPTATCDNPTINFAIPWGITNPAGFGGTMINGSLVQAGGGQNTIKNTPDNAPFPIGAVLTGVAKPSGCGPAVLITGSLTAPRVPGEYALSITHAFANVIKQGETGDPFWATEAVEIAESTPLTLRTVPAKRSPGAPRSLGDR